MSAQKFVTEIISAPIQILVSSPDHPIVQSLLAQLKLQSRLKIDLFAKQLPDSQIFPHLIIHFAGFGPPSLEQTISSTSRLHELLEQARRAKAKFVLVVPATSSSLKHTAESLALQYSQTYSLKLQVVALSPSTPPDSAAEQIISKFIYRYRRPQSSSVPASVSSSPLPPTRYASPSTLGRLRFPRLPKSLTLIVLTLLSPYLLFILQVGVLAGFSFCTLTSLSSRQLPPAVFCSSATTHLVQFMLPQAEILPGIKSWLTSLGYPPDLTSATAISLSDSLVLLDQLNASLYSQFRFIFSISPKSPDPGQTTYLLGASLESLAYLQSHLRNFYTASSRPPAYLLTLAHEAATLRSFIYKLNQIVGESGQLFPPTTAHYLLALQDHTELRPTGGFLDSFYLLSFSSHRLSQVRSFTSSQADALLKGQVSPPLSMQLAIGETQWFIRDGNWDPDFPTTAKRLAWFVDKEYSQPVDGVVALNTRILPELLQITGPQHTSAFPDSLTSSNYLTNYLNSSPQYPASSDSSLLLDLTSSLSKSLRQLTPARFYQFLRLISHQLDSRQILLSSISSSSSVLDSVGWSGGVSTSPCLSSLSCVKDYFYLVDTNISINQVDPNIQRQLQLDIQLGPDQISSVARVQYTNTPRYPSSTPNYKNYFRLYLPQTARIDTIRLNGKVISDTQFTQTYEKNFLILATTLAVPLNTTVDLQIQYHQPIDSNAHFHYQLDLPPQPGQDPYPHHISLNYPPNWLVTSYITPQSPVSPVASPGLLRYNTPASGITKLDLDITAP